MPSEQLQLLFNALEAHGYQPKKQGDQYISMCPGHNDDPNDPNLSFADRQIKVTTMCRSRDCSVFAITEQIGLDHLQLYYDDRYERKLKKQQKAKANIEKNFVTKDDRNSKREYKDLADYCNFKGFPVDPFLVSGWSDCLYKDKYKAIKITTDGGNRYRLLTGKNKFACDTEPKFFSSWYKLDQAIEIANKQNQDLIFCNGEPSTVIGQYLNLAAFALCSSESGNLTDNLINQLKAKWQGSIVIPIDNDEAGLRGGLKRQAVLNKAGFTVTLVKFETEQKGYDLADFCRDNTSLDNQQLYKKLSELPKIDPQEKKTEDPENKQETENINEDELPEIRVDRQLINILPDAIEIIAKANQHPTIFRQSSRLIRVNEEIKQGTFIIENVEEKIINGILFRGATWVKWNKDGTTTAKQPPEAIINDIIVNPPECIPELESVISAPSFTSDGKIFNKSGYNNNLKVYYPMSRIMKTPKVNPNPIESEVVQCLQFLENDLFGGFPFQTISDYANALATLLEQFIKFQIYGCRPLRAFEAATPGTGKTLLARALCLISFGREANMIPAPEDKQEWSKLITSLLLEMPEVVFFDNVRYLNAPELEAVLTSVFWKTRILGKSLTVECPNKALWLVTGNNMVYAGDLPRRVIPIRIIANEEDPSKRPETDFKHPDLMGWIANSRPEIVHACLTIIQYWVNQGKPLSNYRLGSFESWSTNLGGLLNCIGVKGFLDNLESLHRVADPNREHWIRLVIAWFKLYNTTPVKPKDLLNICDKEELFNFTKDKNTDSFDRSISGKFASLLKSHRDRVFAGYKIVYNEDKTGNGHSSYSLLEAKKSQKNTDF